MNLTRKKYASARDKAIDFFAGFIGWFVVNGALWIIASLAIVLLGLLFPSRSVNEETRTLVDLIVVVFTCIPILLNLIVFGFFMLTRYWVAAGSLTGFVLTVMCLVFSFVLIAGTFVTSHSE